MPEPMDPTRTALSSPAPLGDTVAGVAASPDAVATLSLPTSPSPYTDLVPHARGGLGEVFRATEPILNRTVAVKRLQAQRADDPGARRRFLVEAEVTARLEHPGVVPVYALFRDESGGPAYAMRFVQGPTLWETIREYHAGQPNAVSFRRLLQAFIQVCQTVAYAHSRGVIHRDLKPQNILMGKFGETLVVDWGLAKVVGRTEDIRDDNLAEETLVPSSGSGDETAMGSAVGTPAFMSPEQAAGRWDVIDPRSDVYGLGAVLYTVLTGKAPLESGNWPEMQQRIQRGDIPHPCLAKPGIPRPLEAVCLKAMAVKPVDRYALASELAADVEHWLADEPTSAYREPLAVRGRRWVKRNRTLVGLVAVLLVVGLVAAGVGLLLLERTNREIAGEREAARTAASREKSAHEEADAITRFLIDDLLAEADPERNPQDLKLTVEELLQRASQRIEKNPRFMAHPALEATVRIEIGHICYRAGLTTVAETHLWRAVELRQKVLPPDDLATLAAQEELADFLNFAARKFPESKPIAKATWEARSRVLGPDHPDTLNSLDTYAIALIGANEPNDLEQGERLARECWVARSRVLPANDKDIQVSRQNLGHAQLRLGKFDQAEETLRAAYKSLTETHEPSQQYPLVVRLNLGHALIGQGRFAEARELADGALVQALVNHRPSHPIALNLRNLRSLAILGTSQANPDVELLREAVQAASQSNLAKDHEIPTRSNLLLGIGLMRTNSAKDAEPLLREAAQVFEAKYPGKKQDLAEANHWLGLALVALKRDGGEQLAVDGAKSLLALASVPVLEKRATCTRVAELYNASGKSDKTAEWKKRLAELPPAPATSR